MRRSRERERFLADIVTCAVEGGTGYWAQVSQYQYVRDDGTLCVYTGEAVSPAKASATLHEMEDDGSGYKSEGLTLDLNAVALGIRRVILADGLGVNAELRRSICEADDDNDAGQIDADAADVIAQAALLGSIVYG